LPPEDDPQEMDYRHDEKKRGGDRQIGVSVHSVFFPSASRGIPADQNARLSGRLLKVGDEVVPVSLTG
jgi:hypothetical protein